jgi:hypothetical protein
MPAFLHVSDPTRKSGCGLCAGYMLITLAEMPLTCAPTRARTWDLRIYRN